MCFIWKGEMRLKEVIKLFKKIQETSGTNDKKAIISANKDNELFKKCLVFLLDSNVTTGIAEKKYNSLEARTSDWVHNNISKEFCELLDYIKQHNTGRDEDVIQCQAWSCGLDNDIKDFTRGMITKSIKLGCDKKVVNSAIPNLIPTFDVQLGTSIEKVKLLGNEKIFISRKLNGTRTAFVGDKCMTRQGKEYKGLDHIISDLQKIVGTEMFVDGELLYKNKEGLSDSEAFQKGTGIAMSKDNDKSELKLVIFDMFPLDEFWSGKSKEPYSNRKKHLIELGEKITELGTDNLEIVHMCYEGYDHSEIWKWLDYAERHDWEGVILNLDTPYECKRTKNLIKVKKFYTYDLEVIGVEEGTGRNKGTLGALVVKYKNNTVNVGSGFTDEERSYYWNNQDKIIGRVIEVKYKEITTDKKTGLESLQFPVYVGLRENGKEVSYN